MKITSLKSPITYTIDQAKATLSILKVTHQGQHLGAKCDIDARVVWQCEEYGTAPVPSVPCDFP